MKNQKLKLLLLLIITMSSFGAFSQRGSMTPEEMAKSETEQIKKAVSNLSDEQISSIYECNLKYAKKQKELKSTISDRSQIQNLKKEIKESKDLDLKKIFTQEQYKQYESLNVSVGRQGGGRR